MRGDLEAARSIDICREEESGRVRDTKTSRGDGPCLTTLFLRKSSIELMWFSGRIRGSHPRDPGSIPGMSIFILLQNRAEQEDLQLVASVEVDSEPVPKQSHRPAVEDP